MESYKTEVIKLDDRIRSIIYGTLMGDSYISRHYAKRCDKNTYQFRVEHSTKQELYVKWLRDQLTELQPQELSYRNRVVYIKGRKISSSTVALIICKNSIMWQHLRNIFYDGSGIKRVTPEIMDGMTCESVALWYMDDGCYHQYRNVAAIATHSYTLGEHHIMVDGIHRITGATPTISKKCHSGTCYYYLYFPRDETIKLLHSIGRYIPYETGMRYKVPLGWDRATRLPPNYRQCMPARIPDEDARLLIINNLKWFASNNDVTDGFPVVLYLYTKDSYSFKPILRVFGSVEAALDAAGLPTNFI